MNRQLANIVSSRRDDGKPAEGGFEMPGAHQPSSEKSHVFLQCSLVSMATSVHNVAWKKAKRPLLTELRTQAHVNYVTTKQAPELITQGYLSVSWVTGNQQAIRATDPGGR